MAALGVASPAAAAVTVVSDTPDSVISVDSSEMSRTFEVTVAEGELVTAVVVTLDFQKSDNTCADTGTDIWAYSGEIGFALQSPEGTSVSLINDQYTAGGASYLGQGADPGDRVTLVLDDAAEQGFGEYPASGTFLPAESLSAFGGLDPNGTWTLTVSDSASADPLCYYGASLAITSEAPAQAPSLSGEAAATAVVGESFGYLPAFAAGTPAASVTLAEGVLPEGLTLDASTGAITGVPTGEPGVFELVLAAQNEADAVTLAVTITVETGALATLTIAPLEGVTVAQGSSLLFAVTGTDAGGNAVDVSSDAVLSSSVATDVVDGLRVTFPTASPHTITATHVPTGLTASTVVEVEAAVATASSAADELAATGLDQSAWLPIALGAATFLGLGLGLTVLARRRVARQEPARETIAPRA